MTELEGAAAGAVYRPAEEIVPNVEFPPRTPFTSQLKVVLVVPLVELAVLTAPETVALNCCVWPVCKVALVGKIETDIDVPGADVTTTVALSEGAFGLTLCAVTVTAPEGGAAGAVYKPEAVIVPTAGLPPKIPFTSQFTASFFEPDTVAENCCDWPTCRLLEGGEIATPA